MPPEAWKPTTFRRWVQAFATSTHPSKIITDAGPAFIKVINNPMGPHALVREWVCTHLARWFGLPTLDCAILKIGESDEVILHGGEKAIPGHAFVTRAIPGTPWSGAAAELGKIDNPQDLAKLVVFDTWTRNPDRYPPPSIQRRPKVDNVFLTGEGASAGRLRLIAMDFTECFTSGARRLDNRLSGIEPVKDGAIYGLFPSFKPYIELPQIRESAARLAQLDMHVLSAIVSDLPNDWEVSLATRTAIVEFLRGRAGYLVDTIIDRLRSECWPGEIPFE